MIDAIVASRVLARLERPKSRPRRDPRRRRDAWSARRRSSASSPSEVQIRSVGVMPTGLDLNHPVRVPEKPALEGLEAKWTAGWEQDGVYRFDRIAPARRRLLDRHAAADRQRIAARRPRLFLHAHRRHRAVQADARQGRVLSDGMGRQRPADRAARAELLRRPLRSVAARTIPPFQPPRPAAASTRRSRSRGRTSSSSARG